MEESDKIKPEDRPILNNLRYKFCKENNKHLLEYLKTASEHQRSSSCNHEQHRLFQELYPMDSALKNELSEYLHKPVEVIDITLSEDGDENIDESLESNQDSTNNISTKLNQTTIDDLIYAIKECLGNQTYLDSSILNNLQSSSLETYHVFKDLSQVLNHKEAINLGISLISSSVSSELLIEHYIHHLLIKELSLEFSEGLLNLINDVSLNHEDILIQELTTYLSNTEDNLKISLQFLERVNNDLKSKLLRSIVFNSTDLKGHLISCLEVLISAHSDYDTLNRLVDLMSTSANNYNQDKKFGKFFIVVIKCVGKNVTVLEQPLKHIVNSHKSVWKSKMQKTLNDSIQDNLILTQSFRY